MDATSPERNITKNVVFREVLLHRRQPPPPQVPVPTTPAIPLEHGHSSDLDYNGVYDNREEQAQSVSASLPSNVTLAPLPTAREAEVFFITKKQLLNWSNRPPESEKPCQRVSNADRKVFANPESFCDMFIIG